MVQDFCKPGTGTGTGTETERQEYSFEDLLALQLAWTVLGELETDSCVQRARALEDLYAAVSSFVNDSAVYDGTPREDKYRTAFLRHRLPILTELLRRVDSLSPFVAGKTR